MSIRTFFLLSFIVVQLLAAAPSSDVHVVVAANGTGKFQTVQSAIDRALDRGPLRPEQRLRIDVRPGTYQERVKIPQDRPRLTLRGADAANTVITFNAGAKDVGGTFFSSTADVEGAEFEAANITFENSYGTGTQAVAITIHSDRAAFRKCRFVLARYAVCFVAEDRQLQSVKGPLGWRTQRCWPTAARDLTRFLVRRSQTS